ncbi:MAG TPA: molecular chaperone DnaK, partial [Psychrobacter sp.]|nr:molecular chaperone DnaK [Psychrobacter sp.]
ITADSSGPKHLVITISRSKLESLTEDLVQRTMDPCKTALEDAGLKIGDINDVILVGGQTRMPLVQQKVQEFFGQEPRKDVNPDEAVAAGAAIQGAVLSGDKTDVLLLDVTPLTLGIETMGGVMTPVIEKNTMIPTKKSQVFSTAEDSQPAVTIQVYQGERKIANQNKLLGRFDLTDIPPAPRGLPQIEVSFDINADGIMNISATDKGTGKAQSIQIKADSGLSDEEVEQMVRDAEANAAEDEKFANLAQVRNEADGRIHAVQKALKEAEDKVTDEEKSTVESAITELEAAAKEDDHDEIKAKLEALDNAFLPVSQKIYADSGAGSEGMDPSQFQQGADATGSNQADDDVVDAEFTEVDEDKK